mmetsp:Transcript_27023/g.77635  ORF Transcript_27023/g.77635 Transcript_27023/m.77635 type:complete len:216 (-) Transcript_27023:1759-2406(-)
MLGPRGSGCGVTSLSNTGGAAGASTPSAEGNVFSTPSASSSSVNPANRSCGSSARSPDSLGSSRAMSAISSWEAAAALTDVMACRRSGLENGSSPVDGSSAAMADAGWERAVTNDARESAVTPEKIVSRPTVPTSLPSRSRAYGNSLRGSLCPSKSVKVRTDRLESAGLRGTPLAPARRPPSSSNGSASSPWRPEGADTIILNVGSFPNGCLRTM